jgi:hypothetical protein
LLTHASKHWPGWQSRLLAGVIAVEAWFRRQGASRRGDLESANLFRRLQSIACDFRRGCRLAARKHLVQIIRGQERRRAS